MLSRAKHHIMTTSPDRLDDNILGNLLPFTKFVRSGVVILKEKELAFFSEERK